MQLEKWHALGNDYLIVEQRALPFALAPAVVRMLCDRHEGIGSDGVVLIEPPRERATVAHLRIFNPDGSEAELSGNGVRQALIYIRRRGLAAHDAFSVTTAAGEIRARITGPETCSMDIGRVRLASDAYPSGARDGRGELVAAGRSWRFQFVDVGNPQCAIEVGEELESLDLAEVGSAIENAPLFPNRTNVSFWRRLDERTIRARIWERGVGETRSSGTGATGAAVAAVLRGVDSPVRVVLDGGELQVDIGEDLHVDLHGWARPLFRAELSDDFRQRLWRAASQRGEDGVDARTDARDGTPETGQEVKGR